MKVLLLKPINDVYYIVQPSLGLGYVASIVLRHGHDVRLLHAGKENLTWERFEREVADWQPDIVGIQMLSSDYLSTMKHLKIVRRVAPGALTLVGGAHISGDPNGVMAAMPELDLGFVGEAEQGLDAFLDLPREAWKDPRALAQIPNLVWRGDGRTVVNVRTRIKDLTEIPFPAWQLMKPADYPVAPHGNFCKKVPVAPIITSRGCPFPCTFCAGHNVTSRQVRLRTPEHVMAEIEMLYNDYGVREIHVEDEVFTLHKEYAADICNRIIASKMDLALSLPNGVRLDSLDEEILRLLERAGFYSMGVGVESGSDRVLGLMRKHMSTGEIRRQVDLIKRVTNIHLTGFFILGYPTETVEEIEQTIQFARSLKLDKANFMFLSPLPGSEVWEQYCHAHSEQIDWGNTFSYRITQGLTDIPPQVMRRLHRRAVRKFYLRPHIILDMLSQIKSREQLVYLMRRVKGIFA